MSTEFILDESTIPEQVVNDLRHYLLQQSLTISDVSSRTVGSGEIQSGQAVVRGLDCAVDLYYSNDKSVLVLCARPTISWVFGDCFPEIPNQASVNQFFVGNPPKFKEPLLSQVGLTDSVWVLISPADETPIHLQVVEILTQLEQWPSTGDTSHLGGGLNLFGKPSFGRADYLRNDALLQAILPGNWDSPVQANVEYRDGAPMLSLPISLDRELTLVEPYKLTHLTLWLSTPMYYVRHAPDVRLEARLQLSADRSIKFTADYPLDDDIVQAQLEVAAGQPPPFINETPGLPDFTPSDIELTVGVTLSKGEKTLTKAYLDLVLRKEWTILSDILVIANPEFHFLVLDPVAPTRQVMANITGQLRIVGSTLAVSGHYAAAGGNTVYGQFTVRLDPVTPLSLTHLIQHLRGKNADAVTPALPEYTLDTLHFEYELDGHIFMETSISVPWNIEFTPEVNLEFKELRFLFEKWGESQRFRATAALELSSQVQLQIEATYDSRHKGWQFTGRAQNVPAQALIEWIRNKFGEAVPKVLETLAIEDLRLELNTKTKFIQFTCDGKFEVAEDPQAWAAASITLTRNTSAAQPSFELGGHLQLGDKEFQLSVAKDGDTGQTSLLATYQQNPAQAIHLHDSIDTVSEDVGSLVPDSLAIAVRDVYFAWCKETKRASAQSSDLADAKPFSGFLLGADLEASIQLSDIPLAGESLPADLNAGINQLRIVLASKAFQANHLVGINQDLEKVDIAALELHEEPGQTSTEAEKAIVVAKGMSLSAELTLGEDKRSVSLTTARSKSPQTKGTNGEAKSLGQPERAALAPDNSTHAVKADTDASASSASTTKSDGGGTWIALDKKMGPVEFHRIGLQYQNSALWVLLDVAFSSSGLTLTLDGLGVGSPLSEFKPKFKLDGIGLDYTGSSGVAIGGAFLHEQVKNELGQTFDQYSGVASIETEALKLSAIGAYAEMDGYASMFVYAFLDKPLGGPSFFFVTGLAAGFGYNRALKSPTKVEEIASFPLVSIAMGSNPVADTQNETSALMEILSSLGSYIPPAPNQYFLALGIKFTSFKLIDSFALLVATFGDEFRLKLLGLSKIVAPPAESGKTPVAEVTIGLIAEFVPDDGLLKIDGKIMPGSYVLDRDCQLTGGFAFYSWFSGSHAGDFVLTVGGYHPRFRVPAHYPQVDRLALNWQIDSDLSVKGSTYFALTSGAVMAGGVLEARLDRGRLQAWFDLSANFLVCWQPFHYDVDLSIEIGASYRTWLGTIRASLGAGVHIWGPEFAGIAHIHFYFVSFSVSFGATGIQKPPALSWKDFKTSFLPPVKDICTIAVKDGLARTKKEEAGQSERWAIDPKHLALAIDSVIPIQAALGLNGFPSGKSDVSIGIGSMDIEKLASTLTVTAKRGPGQDKQDCLDDFRFVPVFKSVPSALWGKERQPDLNGKPIPDVLCGFEVRPAGHPAPGDTHDIKCSVLRYNIDESKPEIGRQNPVVVEQIDRRVSEAEKKEWLQAMELEAENFAVLVRGEDRDDPFDPYLNPQLIEEFLELPQIVLYVTDN